MKLTLVLSFLFASTIVCAETSPRFAEQKARVLEHMTAQMSALENTKKCVEAATDREGIKKCHEQAKEERKKFEDQRIDQRMKNLEEKKKALEEKKK